MLTHLGTPKSSVPNTACGMDTSDGLLLNGGGGELVVGVRGSRRAEDVVADR